MCWRKPSYIWRFKKIHGHNECYCVPNAICLSRFNDDIKPEHCTSNVALIFGTHYYGKGVDLAIKAIQRSGLDIVLRVVTNDIATTKRYIESGFGYVPSFVELVLPTDDVQQLYNSAFAFLSPSRSEAFGYAVAQATYCGCQVIASDIPGQNTQKNIIGVKWAQHENYNMLCDEIVGAYNSRNDKMLRDQLEVQKQCVIDNYSIDSWSEKMLCIISKASGETA